MSQTNLSGEEGIQGDPVSEEFEFYFPFAKTLALDLNTPEDTSIAAAWVQKLETEPESDEEKQTRLNYLKLLLFVLQRGRLSGIFKKQPPSGALQPFPQGMSILDMGNLMLDQDDTPSCGGGDARCLPYNIEISNDLREFVASQEIPNFGVQMYYAWSSEEPVHKWLSFDEDKFPQFVLDKIKQLKEVKSDEKSTIIKNGCIVPKKGCDLSIMERCSKKRVKTPQEIERSQGRSYHTYMGLVGRMGNFDKCDDDPEKGQRQDPRRGKFPPKRNGQKRYNGNGGEGEDMIFEEDGKNFMPGFGGANSLNRPCFCVNPNQPDVFAKGGPQPFEIQQASGRNWPYGARFDQDNAQWAAQGNKCLGQRRAVEDLNAEQLAMNQQMQQQQQQQFGSRRSPSPRPKSSPSPHMNDSPNQCPPQDNPRDFCNDEPVCICTSPPCTCPCPRAPAGPNGNPECRKPVCSSSERPPVDPCQQSYSNRRNLGEPMVGVIQGVVTGESDRGNLQGNEGMTRQRVKQPDIIHCYDATNPDPELIQAMGSYWDDQSTSGFPNICPKSRPPADKPSQNAFQQKSYNAVRKDPFSTQQQRKISTPEPVCHQTPATSRMEQKQDICTPASVGQTLYPPPQARSPRTPPPQAQPCVLPQEQQQCIRPGQQMNFAPQQYQQYQGPTQDAQMMGEFDDVCARPQVASGRAQDVCGRPQDVCARPQDVSGRSQNVSGRVQNASGRAQDVCGRPQDVCARPQDVCARPQDVCARPQDVSGRSQNVSGRAQSVSGRAQDVCARPQDVCARPQDVSGRSQDVCARPPSVYGRPQNVSVGPQDVCARPQDVCGRPQDVCARPQDVCGRPQDVCARPQDVCGRPQDVSERPQDVCGRPQSICKTPQSTRPQNMSNIAVNNNTGRLSNMASLLQGIKQKTEAHREKCDQRGSRRATINEATFCQQPQPQANVCPGQPPSGAMFAGPFGGEGMGMRTPVSQLPEHMKRPMTQPHPVGMGRTQGNMPDRGYVSFTGEFCGDVTQYMDLPLPSRSPTKPCQPSSNRSLETCDASIEDEDESESSDSGDACPPEAVQKYETQTCQPCPPQPCPQPCPQPKTSGRSPQQAPCAAVGDPQSPGRTKTNVGQCQWVEPSYRIAEPGLRPDGRPVVDMKSPRKSPKDACGYRDGGDVQCIMPKRISPGKTCPPQEADTRPCPKTSPGKSPVPQDQLPITWVEMTPSPRKWAKDCLPQACSPRKQSPPKVQQGCQEQYNEDYDDMPSSATALARQMGYQPEARKHLPKRVSPGKMVPDQSCHEEFDEMPNIASAMHRKAYQNDQCIKQSQMPPTCPRKKSPAKIIPTVKTEAAEWMDMESNMTQMSSRSGRSPKKECYQSPPKGADMQTCSPQKAIQGKPIQQMQAANDEWEEAADFTTTTSSGTRDDSKRSDLTPTVFPLQYITEEGELTTDPFKNRPKEPQPAPAESCPPQRTQGMPLLKPEGDKTYLVPPGTSKQPPARTRSSHSNFSQPESGRRQNENIVSYRQNENIVSYRQNENIISYRQNENIVSYRQNENNVGHRQSQKDVGDRQSQGNVNYSHNQSNVGYRQGQSDVGYRQSQSIVGNTQNQDKVGYRQSQSNVGNTQNQNKVGYVQSPSNVGSTKNQNNVGYRQDQSNVGYRQDQSNVGYRQDQSNVGYRQDQSNVGYRQSQSNVGNIQNQDKVGSGQTHNNVGNTQNQNKVGSGQTQSNVGNTQNQNKVGYRQSQPDVNYRQGQSNVDYGQSQSNVSNTQNQNKVGSGQTQSNVGNTQNQNKVGSGQTQSNVGNTQNQDKVGYRQSQSNVGNTQNQNKVGYGQSQSNVGYVQNPSDVSSTKNQNNVGNRQDQSNVGYRQSQSNVGYGQAQSNVGYRQSQGNVNYRQRQSNDSRRYSQSNVGNTQIQNKVGYRQSQSNVGNTQNQNKVGYRQSQGSVKYRQSQSNVGYKQSQANVNYRQRQSNDSRRYSQSNVGNTQIQNKVGYRQAQSNVGYRPSQGNVKYRQSQSNVGHRQNQSNIGHRQSQSNVGRRQSQSNGGHRQSQSNVGHRQSQSNVGRRQSQSNGGHRQSQSNVGHRQSQSNVGRRHNQSNADRRQSQGSVGRRQRQSTDSCRKSKPVIKSAVTPPKPVLRADTNSKTAFKPTAGVNSNTACNEMGIDTEINLICNAPIICLPKMLWAVTKGITPLRGPCRAPQQVPCYTPSQMAELKTCVQLMQESAFPSCEGNPYTENSAVYHKNQAPLVKISSPQKWRGSVSHENIPDISSIHVFDSGEMNNPNAQMQMQPCNDDGNVEFMPFCSMNADCGVSKFFNLAGMGGENQEGECPQPQDSGTTGCSYQDNDSFDDDDEDTIPGFYPC